jgi:hypothetical protein
MESSLRERVRVRESIKIIPCFISPHPTLLPEGEGTETFLKVC